MKRALLRLSWSPLVVTSMLGTNVATAQDSPSAPALSNLETLSHIINWGGLAVSVLVIFLVLLSLRFIDNIVNNIGAAFAERRLLLQRINAFIHFFAYVAMIATAVLLSFELSPQVLAIIGGSIAVAVGFATKDLMASLVAGLMIIFDRPFQVGDRVRFEGEFGDILTIGLRSVKLRTLDDSTVTIPNNLFLSNVTASSNSGQLDMQTVIDFHIGVDQDAKLAQELVNEATALSRYIFLPKPIVVHVSQKTLTNCVALRLRLKAYVLDTCYEKDFESDVTLRVMDAFAKADIRPPAALYRNAGTAPEPVDAVTLPQPAE